MKNIMYRWYYKEEGKTTISGVVLAKTWDEAFEKTKEYLEHQFDDINGEMRFSTSLWIWEAAEDDDYDKSFPDCLAVAY